MQIDSLTTQSFILSLLQFSELYSNCTTLGGNLKKSKFKKNLSGIFQYSLNMYRYTANLLKI